VNAEQVVVKESYNLDQDELNEAVTDVSFSYSEILALLSSYFILL